MIIERGEAVADVVGGGQGSADLGRPGFRERDELRVRVLRIRGRVVADSDPDPAAALERGPREGFDAVGLRDSVRHEDPFDVETGRELAKVQFERFDARLGADARRPPQEDLEQNRRIEQSRGGERGDRAG